MKRFVVPGIELFGLLSAGYFGVQWYLNPDGNYEAAFMLSGIVAFLCEWFRRHLSSGVEASEVSAFIQQGQALISRKNETPLPIAEHNEWVERMEAYFRKLRRTDYEVRLSDFSGLTFYGDGTEKSKYANAIDGRLRRLHEFLRDLGPEKK
jgi:hypothetical protein